MSNQQYAGDLSPAEAWELLKSEAGAVLVDVRTDAEWSYVGVPDLGSLGKSVQFVSWTVFPRMERNADFTAQVAAVDVAPDTPMLFLCRSGQRSQNAAKAMTERGFSRCYNILGGFEGDKDETGHRGRVNGWKVAGLPWIQG